MDKLIIKDANIYDVNTGNFSKSNIITENGIIKEISNKTIGNTEANIIDAKGMDVYPGFIDAHTHMGLTYEYDDCNECTNPATPEVSSLDSYNFNATGLIDTAKAGFSTIMIAPGSGNVIGGKCAILKTYGKNFESTIVKEYAALKIAFGENPKMVYGQMSKKLPMTRMGTASVLCDNIERALLYKENLKKGGEPDPKWDVFLPVLNREIPMKIHAHRADDILTAIRIMDRYNLKFTLDHCTEGYLISDKIKITQAPVIIGPIMRFKTKPEVRNSTTSSAKILSDSGISVSLCSDYHITDSMYLPMVVGQLVSSGLDFNTGIKMLTLNPAKALGMEDSIGSIEVGKSADFFICDGNPLELRSTVVKSIVQGLEV